MTKSMYVNEWSEGVKGVWLNLSSSLPPPQGDTVIRYFEVTDDSPYVFFLTMFQGKGSEPHRGAGYMPKRHLDYMKCETMRFYRLLNKNIVEPLVMKVPRKVSGCALCSPLPLPLHLSFHFPSPSLFFLTTFSPFPFSSFLSLPLPSSPFSPLFLPLPPSSFPFSSFLHLFLPLLYILHS